MGGAVRPRGALVLAYHDVGDDPVRTNFYTVTPRQLRDELDSIASWGFQFVDLSDLVDALDAQAPSIDGLVAVTFDDSLVGVHRHAAPLLAELGVPGTVFAVSGELGEPPSWWAGSDRLMTKTELRECVAGGMRLGSHTRTHRSLPALNDQELTQELTRSRVTLSELAGTPVDLLAYPRGHVDARTAEAARSSGYRAAFGFRAGRVLGTTNLFRLPRLPRRSGYRRARLAYEVARPADSWVDPTADVTDSAP
jgi:peptidoglycan/xylan/chitin deacetylase (PgdA/CDA1 family)